MSITTSLRKEGKKVKKLRKMLNSVETQKRHAHSGIEREREVVEGGEIHKDNR